MYSMFLCMLVCLLYMLGQPFIKHKGRNKRLMVEQEVGRGQKSGCSSEIHVLYAVCLKKEVRVSPLPLSGRTITGNAKRMTYSAKAFQLSQ